MEKYVSLNIWAIRIIGISYPEGSSPIKLNIYGLLRFLTLSSILFILIPAIIEIRYHLRINYDISKIVEIIALVTSASLVFLKIFNLYLQIERVKNLLNTMSKFWNNSTIDELIFMNDFALLGKKVTKFYFTLGILSIISFIIQPFFNNYISFDLEKNLNNLDYLPFNGWNNFIERHKSNYIFVIIFFTQIITGTIASLSSLGYDCFFVVLILHVCANLRALHSSSLKNLNFSHQLDYCQKEVNRCAKKFQLLIEYTTELENVMNLFLLAQSVSSILVICFTSFMLSRDIHVNKELIKYLTYWSAALFQLFIFCWASNYLQTEVNLVGLSAYEAYGKLVTSMNLNNNNKIIKNISRNLQMILICSQNLFKIRAGKFYIMSLENYKNILSTSYSYFTVLRAFADNKTLK